MSKHGSTYLNYQKMKLDYLKSLLNKVSFQYRLPFDTKVANLKKIKSNYSMNIFANPTIAIFFCIANLLKLAFVFSV